jgi:predicted Zn-dependent protease
MSDIARRYLKALLAPLVVVAIGCSSRTPVAPGEIPQVGMVSIEDEEYGQQVLSTLTQTYPLERDDTSINRARDVVERLAKAAGADQTPWNVFVLRGDQVVNAAATRGNYVFVWTGMLNTIEREGELAAVLAHEMGHVLAGHTNPTAGEEAGQIMANVTGEVASRVVAAQGPYGALGQLAGILAQEAVKALIVNPESQRQEFEADQIGVFLMADARYHPSDSISLWSKMAQQEGSSAALLQFLSSHPATEERLEGLNELLPAATERYEVAVSLAARRTKDGGKGGSKANHDTFAINKRRVINTPKMWRALEENTTIFSSPSTQATVVGHLNRDESVAVLRRRGDFFEVESPLRGFVLASELYPHEQEGP